MDTGTVRNTTLLSDYLSITRSYLTEKLIPFWAARVVEPKFGGFQTNYDRDGNRTAVTEKSLLAHCRCLFAISHATRLGFAWPGADQALTQGLAFLFKYFKDERHDGYFWIVAEDGSVIDDNKIIYGHSFLIYALAEYALLTGDRAGRDEAVRAFDLLRDRAADPQHGGFFEHFNRSFELKKARTDATAHKSLDVHMHLMEAFTTLFELTGSAEHRQALTEVAELIFKKMTDPKTGVGIAMFTPDWVPIANVELETVWGRDRFDEKGKPPEITSYGHNIELAWLYLHALNVLGIPPEKNIKRVVPIFEHTWARGVDWQHGGIFVEGWREGEPTETTKEFWQQAEALVGFLDAYALTSDDKYLEAFRNVYEFVFTKMINWEQGEWFALLNREGQAIWDYMGTSWKVCYHTVRGMCQVVKKLERILEA